MATIIREFIVSTEVENAWSAVRDVGAVHQRLVPGLVIDATLKDGMRRVVFANGLVLQELIVSIDDDLRRIAYASVNGRTKHHNASIQVFPQDKGFSKLIWITDVLPDESKEQINATLDAAIPIIVRTLSSPTS